LLHRSRRKSRDQLSGTSNLIAGLGEGILAIPRRTVEEVPSLSDAIKV
jgi:hypothetical protein